MTTREYEELYCTYCDSQRCGSNPPETCLYKNMRENGYDYYIIDELGGVHTDGVGYAPDGRFCGECTKATCVSCGIIEKHEEISCTECIYSGECSYEANSGACPCGVREGED